MADFPSDLSSARTEGTMKTDLDAFLDSTTELFSGSWTSAAPAAGTLTVTAALMNITGTGAVTIDTLSTSALQEQRGTVLLIAGAGVDLTVTHLTGNLRLRGQDNFTFTSGADAICLRRQTTQWIELWRYEREPGAIGTTGTMLHWLGLGDAAFKTVGPGNGLDADTLDGNEASAFLTTSGKAADSELLDGLDSTAYARTGVASLQDFLGALRAQGGTITVQSATSPRFEIERGSDVMAYMEVDNTNQDLTVRLDDTAGSQRGYLRIDQGDGRLYYNRLGLGEVELTPGVVDAGTLGTESPDAHRLLFYENGATRTITPDNSTNGVEFPTYHIDVPETGLWRLELDFNIDFPNGKINGATFNIRAGATGTEKLLHAADLTDLAGATPYYRLTTEYQWPDTHPSESGTRITRAPWIVQLTSGWIIKFFGKRSGSGSNEIELRGTGVGWAPGADPMEHSWLRLTRLHSM